MRKSYLLSGVAAVALLLANPIGAKAADIPVEPEPMLYDWSGIYLGVHAGGGAIVTDGVYDLKDDSSAIDLGALGDIGGIFGGQVGFNWQAGNLVFGIEGDISWADLGRTAHEISDTNPGGGSADVQDFDTTGINLDTDFLASIRGRIGWADDNVLFYATGGVAWYEGEISVVNDSGCGDNPDDKCSVDVDDTGGVVGAGIEWAPGGNPNISIRAEGLYYFFDDKQLLCDPEQCGSGDEQRLEDATTGDNFELDDALVARLGVNFRFNLF